MVQISILYGILLGNFLYTIFTAYQAGNSVKRAAITTNPILKKSSLLSLGSNLQIWAMAQLCLFMMVLVFNLFNLINYNSSIF